MSNDKISKLNLEEMNELSGGKIDTQGRRALIGECPNYGYRRTIALANADGKVDAKTPSNLPK